MKNYTVFVDEVFENFMNLPSLDGYFCYCALMVPRKKTDRLEYFVPSLEDRLKKAYFSATGYRVEKEFKSTYLTKLSPEATLDAYKRIARFLRQNKCFIGVFWTNVHGLLCWDARSSAVYEKKRLEDYSLEKLQSVKQELNNLKKTTVGESALLQGLFHSISQLSFSWISALGGKLEVCYDSRNKKEDKVLLGFIDNFLPKMVNMEPRFENVYLGSRPSSSDVEPGLRLVDLICKAARNYLRDEVPELFTEHSKYCLIPQDTMDEEILPVQLGGRIMPWGVLRPITDVTGEKIADRFDREPFSVLFPHLADHKISGYAKYGESRVVNFREIRFEDMTD